MSDGSKMGGKMMFKSDELFDFDLQLFGADVDLEGVEDDDSSFDADENLEDGIKEINANEDINLEELLKSIADEDEVGDSKETDSEPDEEKPESESEEKTEAEEEENPEKEPSSDETGKEEQEQINIDEIVNQRVIAELNRIIPERLARDRKTQQVAQLEQLTGMDLEGITQTVINNMVDAKAEELGISEEEARAIVTDKLENVGLKTERAIEKQQQAEVNAAMQQVNYLKDKTMFMAKPKISRIIKQYEAEIDSFTQNGKVLSFEDGMKYVLGTKLATGELLQKVQAGAEQKAARSLKKTTKATPQSKSAGIKSDAAALTRQEKIIAANLGISEKEYAKEKLSEINRKQRKSR